MLYRDEIEVMSLRNLLNPKVVRLRDIKFKSDILLNPSISDGNVSLNKLGILYGHSVMSYYINAYHDIDKSFARPDGRIRRTISDMNSSRDYPDALKKDEQIKKLNKDILAVIDGGH